MSKQIPIELNLPLQVEMKMYPGKLSSLVIGYVHDRFIIATLPQISAADVKTYLAPGKQIIIRYIFKGTVLGFKTTVLGTVLSPVKVMFFRYPEEVDDCNLRKVPRVKCFLPSKVQIDKMMIKGTTLDLSDKGSLFTFTTDTIDNFIPPDVGIDILVFITLPGVEGEHAIYAKLRNVRPLGDKTSFGIEFTHMADDVNISLRNYLAEIQLAAEES